ncbi:MAG TPA: hypothetical protein VGC01_09685 [Mucilaginibacter sp.]
MRNIFISGFTVLFILFSGNVEIVKAQDSIKKTTVIKKTVVNPAVTNPAAISPATGKPAVPINPKTGKPYSKWGYGAYSKNKYDATKGAAPATVTTTPSAPPATKPQVTATVVTQPPVAPSDSAAVPTDKSLNGQYHYVLSKIYHYQEPLIAALWKNFTDTLNANRRKLLDAQAKATAQAKAITDLQAESASKDAVTAKADEISIFGISLAKNTYSAIMWGLVIILGATAAVVIVRTGSLKHEATYRTGLYNELEEEFKAYKTKANEKEKKLARELQTERNKLDELMGRG